MHDAPKPAEEPSSVPSAKDIFLDALDLPPMSRMSFVETSCRGIDTLYDEVMHLLASHEVDDTDSGKLLDMDFGQIVVAELSNDSPSEDAAVCSTCHFELGEELGRGGFGVVLAARQTTPVERDVAIKFLRTDFNDKQLPGRFVREQRTLALMNHPNVARIFDTGTDQLGRPFFTMELVRGIPVSEYCDQNRLTINERLAVFIDVCKGIQHAHQKGIVHKDIKPDNVLVSTIAGAAVPKVIDFGIARLIQDTSIEETRFTQPGQLVGSPAYMSPEQADPTTRDVDTRSDQYSLGVLLYELLTGSVPFDRSQLTSSSFAGMLRCIQETEPSSPSSRIRSGIRSSGEESIPIAQSRSTSTKKLMHNLRGDLDWIVMKCLEKDRDRRYESVSVLIADIQRHLRNEPVIAARPSNVYRACKFVRRNQVGVTAAAVVVLALTAGIVGATQGMLRAVRAQSQMDVQLERTKAAEQNQQHELNRVVFAEKKKERELYRANEVKQLTMAMLTNVRPEQAGGKDTALLRRILSEASDKLNSGEITDGRVESEIRQFVAESCLAIGRVREAENHLVAYRKNLADRGVAENDPAFLWADGRLGEVSLLLGKLDVAKPMLTRRYQQLLNQHGEQHSETLRLMLALGKLHSAKKLYESASDWYSKVVAATAEAGFEDEWVKATSALGDVLRNQEKYAEAEAKYREVLDREHSSNDRMADAFVLGKVGQLYLDMGKFEIAKTKLVEAIELQVRVCGDQHPETLISKSALGRVYFKLKDYRRAEKVLLPTCRTLKRKFDLSNPQARNCQTRLSQTYLSSRQYDKAVPLLTELYDAYRTIYDRQHPLLLSTAELLGQCYLGQKDYDAAAVLLADIFEARKESLGNDDPKTLSVQQRLATSLYSAKKYDEAKPIQADVLERRQRVLGKEHHHALSSQLSTGLTEWRCGNLEDAANVLSATRNSMRNVLGANHTNTRLAERSLIQVYSSLNQYVEAITVAQSMYDSSLETNGESHATTLAAQRQLCVLQLKTSDLARAELTILSTLKLHRETLGDNHIYTKFVVAQLGNLVAAQLSGTGNKSHNKELCRLAFDLRRKIRGSDYPNTLTSQNNLGYACLLASDYDEAEPMLKDCLERCERILGEDHSLTLKVLENLGVLYLETERYELASEIVSKRLERIETSLGPTDKSVVQTRIVLASTLAKLGKYRQIIKICEPWFPMQKKQAGWKSKNTMSSAQLLAKAYCKCDMFDKSEGVCLEILEACREIHGEQDAVTLEKMVSVALMYVDGGRPADAVKLAKKACDIDAKRGQPNPRRMAILASCYFENGELEPAIKYQEKVVQMTGAEKSKECLKVLYKALREKEKANESESDDSSDFKYKYETQASE